MCDTRGHVYRWEAGGVAFHSQATIIPVLPANGLYITWEDIHPSLVPEGVIHYCPTKLICLENTLHGVITPQEEIISIRENVKGHDIALHVSRRYVKFWVGNCADGVRVCNRQCDGARLWDVQAATGLPLEDLCAPFDTISVCMSKGLGAPIGSLLVGTKEVIARARWFRQMFGGGMRQSGCLAAAADYALTRTLPLLPAVHAQAARLAKAFQDLGARLILPTQTGMVFVDTEPLGFTAGQLTQRALDNKSIILGGSRIVLHFQITDEAVDDLIGVVTALKEECAQSRREGQPTAIAGNRPKDLYDVTAL